MNPPFPVVQVIWCLIQPELFNQIYSAFRWIKSSDGSNVILLWCLFFKRLVISQISFELHPTSKLITLSKTNSLVNTDLFNDISKGSHSSLNMYYETEIPSLHIFFPFFINWFHLTCLMRFLVNISFFKNLK